MIPNHFPNGPARPELAQDMLHTWLIHVDGLADQLPQLAASLSDDERIRGERFVFERDRRRFVSTRGCLRLILSRYMQVPPAELVFRYNHFGKPEIASPAPGDLTFNLSHSDQLAVCAVTRGREIGVDVERIRDMRAEDIAERFFTKEEQQALCGLAPDVRLQAFFNCWTRKEAWLKAIGRGIGMGLDQVEVSLAPGEPVEFRRMGTERADAWSLLSFTPAADYVGAVAFPGRMATVQFWRW